MGTPCLVAPLRAYGIYYKRNQLFRSNQHNRYFGHEYYQYLRHKYDRCLGHKHDQHLRYDHRRV